MKEGDRYEIELGFWTPILVVIGIALFLVFAGYKLGHKAGSESGFRDGLEAGFDEGMYQKEAMIAKQCDNRKLPMRAAGNGYWCRRIK